MDELVYRMQIHLPIIFSNKTMSIFHGLLMAIILMLELSYGVTGTLSTDKPCPG